MAFTIKTLNAISKAGLRQLPEDLYRVGNDVADPDALILRSANLHGVDIPASVKAVARADAAERLPDITRRSIVGLGAK